ncbi:MAG: DMT family transporter [Desulfurococcales archaeon]|nr:DMT family transporter [Desulfurococcales archaeon]
MSVDIYGVLFAFLAGFLFAVSDVSIRVASQRFSPSQNLVATLVSGLPLLWAMALIVEGVPEPSRGLGLYAAAGLLHFVAGRLLFYTAIAGLGATSAAITSSPTVVISSLLAWLFLGEALSAYDALGVVLVALAVYMAVSKPSGTPLQGVRRTVALASGIGATFIFSITAVVVRAAGIETGAPITGIAVSYTAALPVALVLASLKNNNPPWRIQGIEARFIAVVAWAGVSVSLAQASRYLALYMTTVANAMILISLFPLHTLLLAHIASKRIEGETVTPKHLAAALLALTGITLVLAT